LELYLFTVDPLLADRAFHAGVDGIVVDWERWGKHERQHGADTEINQHTIADLARIRASTTARVICRVNAMGARSAEELGLAIAGGADEVLLPMVRTPTDVEDALDIVAGRAGVGILVETLDAIAVAGELASLPITRVYIGLTDLAIERESGSLFEALVDGTVEQIRGSFDVPVGVAGLTDPDGGSPIPCRLLIAELTRLRCSFTFLRRSFHRDVVGTELEVGVRRLRDALGRAARRPADVVDDEHEALRQRVAELLPRHAAVGVPDA
jgi:hypothetical protein